MGFPRQEYWSELPFPSPWDLPDPGIKPASPALAGGFFTTEPPGKPGKVLLNASSCASSTMRPKKLKCWRLEKGKVYCWAMQGEWVTPDQKKKNTKKTKKTELSEGF